MGGQRFGSCWGAFEVVEVCCDEEVVVCDGYYRVGENWAGTSSAVECREWSLFPKVDLAKTQEYERDG